MHRSVSAAAARLLLFAPLASRPLRIDVCVESWDGPPAERALQQKPRAHPPRHRGSLSGWVGGIAGGICGCGGALRLSGFRTSWLIIVRRLRLRCDGRLCRVAARHGAHVLDDPEARLATRDDPPNPSRLDSAEQAVYQVMPRCSVTLLKKHEKALYVRWPGLSLIMSAAAWRHMLHKRGTQQGRLRADI